MQGIPYWPCSPSGAGRTRWVAVESGLPATSPVWCTQVGRYGLLGDLCMTSQYIYALSAGDVVAVDLMDGAVIWERHLEDDQHKATGICVNGDCLCAGLYIIDCGSGKTLMDIRKEFSRDDIGDYSFVMPLWDGFVRSLEKPSAQCCYFSPKQVPKFLGCNLKGIGNITCIDNMMFGWDRNILTAFDVEKGQVAWALEVPLKNSSKRASSAGYSVLSDKLVLQLWSATLLCVDPLTGRVIWECDEEEVPVGRDAPKYSAYQADQMVLCDDRVYLEKSRSGHGWIECHDTREGMLLWKVSAPNSMSLCAVGDLLFGVKETSILTAWDRYSGEEVWHASDPMTAAYNVMASENKVVYSSTTGEVRCYEWQGRYKSPNKPAKH